MVDSGGVYFLLSHVLGARVGASFGILYCFGQVTTCIMSYNDNINISIAMIKNLIAEANTLVS